MWSTEQVVNSHNFSSSSSFYHWNAVGNYFLCFCERVFLNRAIHLHRFHMSALNTEPVRSCIRFMVVMFWLTLLDELDIRLPPPVAVLHVAWVIAEITLLQGVNGQRDGHFLLSEVLPDRPAGGKHRNHKCMHKVSGCFCITFFRPVEHNKHTRFKKHQ